MVNCGQAGRQAGGQGRQAGWGQRQEAPGRRRHMHPAAAAALPGTEQHRHSTGAALAQHPPGQSGPTRAAACHSLPHTGRGRGGWRRRSRAGTPAGTCGQAGTGRQAGGPGEASSGARPSAGRRVQKLPSTQPTWQAFRSQQALLPQHLQRAPPAARQAHRAVHWPGETHTHTCMHAKERNTHHLKVPTSKTLLRSSRLPPASPNLSTFQVNLPYSSLVWGPAPACEFGAWHACVRCRGQQRRPAGRAVEGAGGSGGGGGAAAAAPTLVVVVEEGGGGGNAVHHRLPATPFYRLSGVWGDREDAIGHWGALVLGGGPARCQSFPQPRLRALGAARRHGAPLLPPGDGRGWAGCLWRPPACC